MNHGAYLMTQERYDEGVAEVRQAADLDPLSIRTQAMASLFLMFARRYDEAIELARKSVELDRNFPFSHAFLGLAYAEQGRFKEALSNLQTAMQKDPHPTILAFGAHVHAAAGDRDGAMKLIQDVEKVAKHRYFCPYEVGTAYVTLKEPDAAHKWFRKGVEDKADCMAWLGVEPWIEPFRSDPRYAQLLKDVGLAPQAAATPR